MYHGIIQEAQWTPRGSYLRAKIEQYQLDKIIDHGRIWRLRFDGRVAIPAIGNAPAQPAVPGIPLDATRPRMLNETAAELVRHLDHPNGWWRDTAQRLLVLKQDRSVVPALQRLAAAAGTPEGRFHALWTLEGLRALDPSFVREQIKDANPRAGAGDPGQRDPLQVRGQVLRRRLQDGGQRPRRRRRHPGHADAERAEGERECGNDSGGNGGEHGARRQEIGKFLLTPAPSTATAGRAFTPDQQQAIDRGATIYSQLCFTCHAEDGRGAPLGGPPAGSLLAPAIAGSPRVQGHRDYVIKTLIHGLSGPIAGRTFPQVMIPMGAQTDQWIADIGSYIRNAFGNSGTFISPSDVARVRAQTKDRKTPWTAAEIERTLPMLMQSHTGWKASASHTVSAAQGLTLSGWTSTEPQRPGMWFQVELPEAAAVTEVQFDAAGGGRLGGGGGNRGRGGRGAVAAGAAAAGGEAGEPARGRGAAAPPAVGYPRQYRVEVSLDGSKWQAVAEGAGAPLTTAAFGRYGRSTCASRRPPTRRRRRHESSRT